MFNLILIIKILMTENDGLLIGSGRCVHSSSVMKGRGGEVIARLTTALGSDGWVGYAGRVLSQRRDRTRGRAHLGWPPALQWQVRAGARGEWEGRRAAPGRRCPPCRRSSRPPLLPRQRSPPAGGRRQGTPPAPCGTAPGGAGGTAAEPPADEPPCCHLPPHSPPLPPHRPEVTRQGSDSAGTLHGLSHTHTHTSNKQQHNTHIIVTQISTTHWCDNVRDILAPVE